MSKKKIDLSLGLPEEGKLWVKWRNDCGNWEKGCRIVDADGNVTFEQCGVEVDEPDKYFVLAEDGTGESISDPITGKVICGLAEVSTDELAAGDMALTCDADGNLIVKPVAADKHVTDSVCEGGKIVLVYSDGSKVVTPHDCPEVDTDTRLEMGDPVVDADGTVTIPYETINVLTDAVIDSGEFVIPELTNSVESPDGSISVTPMVQPDGSTKFNISACPSFVEPAFVTKCVASGGDGTPFDGIQVDGSMTVGDGAKKIQFLPADDVTYPLKDAPWIDAFNADSGVITDAELIETGGFVRVGVEGSCGWQWSVQNIEACCANSVEVCATAVESITKTVDLSFENSVGLHKVIKGNFHDVETGISGFVQIVSDNDINVFDDGAPSYQIFKPTVSNQNYEMKVVALPSAEDCSGVFEGFDFGLYDVDSPSTTTIEVLQGGFQAEPAAGATETSPGNYSLTQNNVNVFLTGSSTLLQMRVNSVQPSDNQYAILKIKLKRSVAVTTCNGGFVSALDSDGTPYEESEINYV